MSLSIIESDLGHRKGQTERQWEVLANCAAWQKVHLDSLLCLLLFMKSNRAAETEIDLTTFGKCFTVHTSDMAHIFALWTDVF